MIQKITKLYEGSNLTGAVAGVVYVPILDARTLKAVKVKTDEAVAGSAVFALKKNGVVITGCEAITITTGNKIGTVSPLAIALVEGDELTLDQVSGSVSAPITLDLATDKIVGTDEITETTNKRYVTDAEKTTLANTSNTNTGDQTISDATIVLSDVTTNNVSTARHGFVPKLPNDATKFLDGTGLWTTPSGSSGGSGSGGGGFFYHIDAKPQTYVSPWSDYFDDETKTNARWTDFHSVYFEKFIDNGQLNIMPNPVSGRLFGLIQTIPAGDCTIISKIIPPFPNVATTRLGLGLVQDGVANPTTSDFVLFGAFDDASTGFSIIGDKFKYNAFQSTLITAVGSLDPATYVNGIYLRMYRIGTDWTFQYGLDGINWTTFGTANQSAFFTPKEFGIILSNGTSTTAPVAYRYKVEFVWVHEFYTLPTPGGPVGLIGTPDPTRRIICVGDSLTAGSGVTAITTYPHQLAKLIPGSAVSWNGQITKSQGTSVWQTVIKARAGYSLVDVTDKIIPNVVKHRNTALVKDIVVVWAGTGDLATLGDSGATSYARLVSVVATLKAAGFEVWVCTIIDRNSFTVAGFDTRRADFNTLVLANTAGADKVIDLWADTRLQNAADTTYFQSDTIHLNATGMGVVASLIQAQI